MILFSFFPRPDQLLADLQNVSQRARHAYENGNQNETRLEPMVLNRTLPNQRNQTLNLVRPDSVIEPVDVHSFSSKYRHILKFLGKENSTKFE